MEHWIKLSEYAKRMGMVYRTANVHYHNGLIPYPTKKLPTGSILVNMSETDQFVDRDAIIYCRVSSPNRKEDLHRQVERCTDYAVRNGYNIVGTYKEVASGMNDKRRELKKIIDQLPGKRFTLIVENKDRLTRFGFNYIETHLGQMGSKILVINIKGDDQEDIMKDLVSVMTSFCCRLYGLRRGAKKAREIHNMVIS
jgi:predicted site-specific integrase-resolvase